MAITIRVNKKSDAGRGVLLVANFCGVASQLTIRDDPKADAPTMIAAGEGAVPGMVPVCKAIVRMAGAELQKQLLGDTPEEEAEISQWLSWRTTELKAPCDYEQLKPVNAALEKKTFLAGYWLTLADLVAFAAMHTTVAGFLPTERGALVDLCRWFDFVQHTADCPGRGGTVPFASAFKKVPFAPPAFNPPPPPAKVAAPAKEEKKGKDAKDASPAPAPAGAAAAAAPEGKKADKKAGKDAAAAAPAPEAPGTPAPAEGGKKEKKEKKAKVLPTKTVVEASVSMLNIVVGQITKVWKHPDADALYCEEIDVGEGKPRVVVSGLANHVPEAEFNGMKVCVLANVKPGNVRGQPSAGLVLCASNDSKTFPVQPPAAAAVGERVSFEGHAGEPEGQLNPKKKVLEMLLPDLKTDAAGVPGFKGVPFMTSKGPCASPVPDGMVK